MSYIARLLFCPWLLLVYLASPTLGAVARVIDHVDTNVTYPFWEFGSPLAERQTKVSLRILSLGASIMFGSRSSDGNGLRKNLRDALRFDGYDVNMVGSRTSGTMIDWNHEATEGFVITDMINAYPKSAGYKANVVIINCGTNDAGQGIDPAGAGNRMEVQLNNIWGSPDMSNTCIILSTVLPNGNSNVAANQPTINVQYRALVARLAAAGKCIRLADMDPPSGGAKGWINVAKDISDDGTHPNDGGYKKVAYIFYDAIRKALADGKIVAPAAIPSAATGCDKVFGNGISAGGHTQKGSGWDDGIYYHNADDMGIVISIVSAWDRNQWRFARLWSSKYDDLIAWIDTTVAGSTTHTNEYAVWKNSADGNGKYTKLSPNLPVAMWCDAAGLHFIDMNADGLDDIVCIAANGDASLALNLGDGSPGKPPNFKPMGVIKTNEGQGQSAVRLADIDGDGRGDYGVVINGETWWYRNGGTDDTPAFWQALGKRAGNMGVTDSDNRGIRYEDINGDGRDDWMWVSATGAVTTWTAAESCLAGVPGDGMYVAWRQAFHKDATSGPTHAGVAAFLTANETYLRDRVHFGRVYGVPQGFATLGRQDYIFMQHTALPSGLHQFDIRVWKNQGFGGTRMKSDGDKYCNIVGHTDGREDYVWTYSTGEMYLYSNLGKTHVEEAESFWDPVGIIWTPPTNLDRRDLHLVDWDGDGDCDIVWVDPSRSNAMSVWINNYPQTKDWSTAWTSLGPQDASVHCNEHRGLGIHDLAVRFADIDGNGRGDYLCMEKNGRTSGYLHNNDGSWTSIPQIKASDGKDRANFRWADVNGDGHDDLLWIEKFGGDGYVYYNRGPGNPGDNVGSSFHWDKISDPVYDGGFGGGCIYFPDLDGNGRADLHQITGTFVNSAWTSFSPSCGLNDRQGDDAGGVVNPGLPLPPADPPADPQDPDDPDDPEDPGPQGNETCDDDDTSDACRTSTLCDYTKNFASLDELQAAAGTFPDVCMQYYALGALSSTLGQSLASYASLNSGYDKLFKAYASYTRDIIPDLLTIFMADSSSTNPAGGPGNKYFDCRLEALNQDETQPCPWGWLGLSMYDQYTITYILRDDAGFYKELNDKYGIQRDWVAFGKKEIKSGNTQCGAKDECERFDYKWLDLPKAAADSKITVPNPKDVITKALPSVGALQNSFAARRSDVAGGSWYGSEDDIVQTLSLPVLMIQQALDSMANAKDVGKKAAKDEKIRLILEILGFVFLFIPFLDVVGPEIAALEGVATFVGVVGNTALAVQDIIQHPLSAPVDILGLLVGGGGKSAKEMESLASVRRGMSADDITKLGPVFSSSNNKLQNLLGRSCKL